MFHWCQPSWGRLELAARCLPQEPGAGQGRQWCRRLQRKKSFYSCFLFQSGRDVTAPEGVKFSFALCLSLVRIVVGSVPVCISVCQFVSVCLSLVRIVLPM